MKVSEQWLREWSNPTIAGSEMIEQLSMAGLEVDAYTPVAPAFDKIVVGLVEFAQSHPNANKLTICRVVIDEEGNTSQIICGAPNARANIHVAVALPGSVLPNGMTIGSRELRGVRSEGMLCSSTELGLGEESDGIIELPSSAPVGMPLRQYLELNDHVIEINITPNRGDCLSVLGVAREIAALNGLTPPKPEQKMIVPTLKETKKVTVHAKEACPHYLGRIIRSVNMAVETPIAMKERLRRAGVRSISPVVDITNYVMLELGQPLHAFDLNRLQGDIQVRWAKPKEKLVLLDGKEITLEDDVLCIADDTKALAMAGIMGGLESAVQQQSTDIFLESAFFTPLSVANRGRRYGLHTDSAQRYERGVSPDLQRVAIERATSLLLEIAGGEAGPITEALSDNSFLTTKTILLRKPRLKKILGMGLPDDTVSNILKALGFTVLDEQEGWKVTVPVFRFDLSREEDLIEEVARVFGYQNIVETALPSGEGSHKPDEKQIGQKTSQLMRLLRSVLIEQGYHEAITYSFVDPESHDLFASSKDQMILLNPISQDMSVMRGSLWPGLLRVVQYNLARQQPRVRLMETGLGFLGQGEALQQVPLLAGVIAGSVLPLQWSAKSIEGDFYDIKHDVEQLLAAVGLQNKVTYKRAENHPALHPGQSAEIWHEEKLIGYLGVLHPEVLQRIDSKNAIALFELYLDRIQPVSGVRCQSISSFPSIRRDLALLVERNIPVASLCNAIKAVDQAALLQAVEIFDVYEGKGVPEGFKSIALALFLQHAQRTLTDEEVSVLLANVLVKLETEFKARLRD